MLPQPQDLRIPVSNHHFLVPEPHIAKELFFEQWRVVGTPPNKAQEMVSRASVLSTDQVLAVMHAVGLGGSHGYLDPRWVGAGVCVCGSGSARLVLSHTRQQHFCMDVGMHAHVQPANCVPSLAHTCWPC